MIEVNATITLPDIVRAAVHRRVQVLKETLAGLQDAVESARDAERRCEETLAEYLAGISTASGVPASIRPLLDALYGVGVTYTVSWDWSPQDGPDALPELITVYMEAERDRACRAGQRGLKNDIEIVVPLGPVADDTAAMLREHHALVLATAEARRKVATLANELARPDMAREMEGELLASMIEEQAPDVAARIESLAIGRRLIGTGA